ncbi:MAG: hypothetical protein ABI682_15740 [Acidobacteriota bacterium]
MKSLVLAFLAALVVTAAGNYVIHGKILQPRYLESPQLIRGAADGEAHAPFLLAAFAVFSLGAVWIFSKIFAGAPWLQAGLTFGAGLWLIASVSRYLTYYAIAPWPPRVVATQIALELPLMLAVGLTIAAILGRRAPR